MLSELSKKSKNWFLFSIIVCVVFSLRRVSRIGEISFVAEVSKVPMKREGKLERRFHVSILKSVLCYLSDCSCRTSCCRQYNFLAPLWGSFVLNFTHSPSSQFSINWQTHRPKMMMKSFHRAKYNYFRKLAKISILFHPYLDVVLDYFTPRYRKMWRQKWRVGNGSRISTRWLTPALTSSGISSCTQQKECLFNHRMRLEW